MSVVLIIWGILEIGAGALWMFSGVGSGTVTNLSVLISVLPGLAMIGNGILFVAAGSGIDALVRMAKASERTARLLDEQFHPRG